MIENNTAEARHKRNLVYNSPRSKQQRADAAAERRGPAASPEATLRIRHLDEASDLKDKHEGERETLRRKRLVLRGQDHQVRNTGTQLLRCSHLHLRRRLRMPKPSIGMMPCRSFQAALARGGTSRSSGFVLSSWTAGRPVTARRRRISPRPAAS